MSSTWMSALALAVAVVMTAGPALAQSSGSTGGGAPSSSTPSGTTSPSTDTKAPGSAGSTGAAGSGGEMKADTPRKASRAATAGGGQENVKQIQQALKDKGMDPGDVDGRMGPKTRAALKEFQKKEGLKETGRPDAETLSKLGVEAKTSSAPGSASPSASPPTAPKGDTAKDAAGTKSEAGSKTEGTTDSTKK